MRLGLTNIHESLLSDSALTHRPQFTITIDLSVVLSIALDTPVPLENPYFLDCKMKILAYINCLQL